MEALTGRDRLAGVLALALGSAATVLAADGAKAPSGAPQLRRAVLASGLHEPIALDVASDGRVYLAERKGALKVWETQSTEARAIGKLDVFTGPEDGILGLVLDPGFATNHWLYLYHSTPGVLENRVSRFTLVDGSLDPATQKILLRIPTRIPKPNHSGGCVSFDAAGNLYASTGDYTLAGESDGFAPLDWRPGRELNDSARTAANTADLRGKILRIHPEPDGTYTVPAGNLFPPGNPKARPEIYIMGCRNPFRFSLDARTGWLYWGDVGPDALGPSPSRGPAGFDEFNVARQSGNYGWPFFSADNRPYRHYDFGSKASGEPFDPTHPVNDSPNNTGLRDLPPAHGAFLWYPPGLSTRWPEVGSGARSAMAGPVYHFDATLASARKLPAHFDGAVILHEWERGWIQAAWLDAAGGQVLRLEPLVPGHQFKRPIHIRTGPDGALYVLEWGSNWADNADAALVRIEADAG